MHILQPVLGVLIFLGISYAMSSARKKISWRLVGVGILMQAVFALLILKTSFAPAFFRSLNDLFITIYESVGEAVAFVASKDLVESAPFMYHVLPTIIVFAALMQVFYHLGVMHRIVYWVGLSMKWLLGTSGAESLSAAANIVMGQTEAPLVVKPYIEKMTRSELMAIMTGGMATVAGGVLAAYTAMLYEQFPQIAGHLIAASIMSAPAALVFAKLIIPEDGIPVTRAGAKLEHKREHANVIHALTAGTTEGLKLMLNIGAMLIVFLFIIHLANFGWGKFCTDVMSGEFGVDMSSVDSLQKLLGWAFAPFAWLMGVPWEEATSAGMFLGEKTVMNEFVAYSHLGDHLAADPKAFSEKTTVILTYALCGFSNFTSIGILLGGLGAIAPGRTGEMAKIGFRALIAASFACFMTAAIAGALV